MKKLSFISFKRNVRKLNLALNLAYDLSTKNYKILLIDLNNKVSSSLSNLNLSLFKQTDFSPVSLFFENFQIAEHIISFEQNKNLDFLMSRYYWNKEHLNFLSKLERSDLLSNNIKNISSLYDYIIIDIPADYLLDSMLKNVIFASDLIISPLIEDREFFELADYLFIKVKDVKKDENNPPLIFVCNSCTYQINKSEKLENLFEVLLTDKIWKDLFVDFSFDFHSPIDESFNFIMLQN